MDRTQGNPSKIRPTLHPTFPVSVSGATCWSSQTPARLLLPLVPLADQLHAQLTLLPTS